MTRQNPHYDCSLLLFISLYILSIQGVRAGELIHVFTEHEKGIYTIDVEMEIDGDIELIRELLLDFGKLSHYNENMTSAKLLYSTGPDSNVGRIEIKDCLLFFCLTLVQVQETRRLPSGNIETRILPEQSDFHKGESLWQFIATKEGKLRIRIHAVMAPKIYVPPVFGPIIISSKLKKRIINMIKELEILALANGLAEENR